MHVHMCMCLLLVVKLLISVIVMVLRFEKNIEESSTVVYTLADFNEIAHRHFLKRKKLTK